jgi:hypothetical protein
MVRLWPKLFELRLQHEKVINNPITGITRRGRMGSSFCLLFLEYETMKTSELTGPALDWAVAKCYGYDEGWLSRQLTNPNPNTRAIPNFSTDWAQGGPIIERDEIELKVLANCLNTDGHPTFKPGDAWEANLWPADKDLIEYCGPTPLIAAMRCFVASRLGDDVEISKELTL